MPASSSVHVVLAPLTEADFATVARLAGVIWRSHYTPIIGAAQVEYMLAGRYVPEKLRAYLGADDRWFELLVVDGEAAGWVSYAVKTDDEMKLDQLYLLSDQKGKGLGYRMLCHAEDRARELGRKTLMLQVNKKNEGSIALYRRAGFVVREEAVFDIGGGYVMDDYVMVKAL